MKIPDRVILIHPEKCAGCRRCGMACSLKHEGYLSLIHARNEIIPLPKRGINVNMVCRQCTNPPCEAVCPQRAISRNLETGAMVVDANRCIGCQSCVIACPIGGVTKNMETGKIIKCNLCDGDPECVKQCAYGAIEYLSPAEGASQKRKEAISKMIDYMKFFAEA
jgi:anaerobic carbon-monoxide dehydrogenase iron sulfur subunit